MAITTFDGLVAAMNMGMDYTVAKASIATQGAGQFSSLWRGTGMPAQGAIPTATGATCLSTLTGSLGVVTVTTALTCYMSNLGVNGSISNSFYVYDRILANGGLSANATTLTTLTGVTVTGITDRGVLADASNVEWWTEIYTDIGTTSGVVTFTYDSPTSSVQTCVVTLGGSSPLNQDSRAQRIIPNAGHPIVGIKNFRFTTATGTAGSWGITATRRLTPAINMGMPNVGVDKDFAGVGMPIVYNDSCIMFFTLDSTTSTGVIEATVKLIQG
jgi:hypothetical protein